MVSIMCMDCSGTGEDVVGGVCPVCQGQGQIQIILDYQEDYGLDQEE